MVLVLLKELRLDKAHTLVLAFKTGRLDCDFLSYKVRPGFGRISPLLDLCDLSSRLNISFSCFLKLFMKYLCYLDSHTKKNIKDQISKM